MRNPSFVALALLLASIAAPASAQDRATAQAQRALDTIDPVACRPSAGFDARVVPLAIVIHRDGGWAVAIGPVAGNGVVTPEAMASFRRCLEGALSAILPAPLPRAPRTTSAVARTWTIPSSAELWVDQRLVAVQGATHRCVAAAVGHARTITARIRIERGTDGQPVATALRPSANNSAVAACIARILGPLPDGLEPLEREVTTALPPPVATIDEPSEPLGSWDGTEGAICNWGQRRGDVARLPQPRVCRAGLTCCAAGGAAGSDSTCIRVSGHCPMYP